MENEYLAELKNIVIEEGIDLMETVKYTEHELSINDYLAAVSFHDKDQLVIQVLEQMGDEGLMEWYLTGTMTRIIMETLNGDPSYVDCYSKILKKIS